MDSPPADAEMDERRRLLAAARAVLARRAWTHVKIDGILREAHLSRRAFYRHFESKDHLFLALLDEESAAAARRLSSLSSPDVESSAERRVFAWTDATLRLVSADDNARRTSLFARLWATLESEFPDELADYRSRLLAPLVAAIADGRRTGVFPDVNPEADALAVYYLVSGIVRDTAARQVSGAPETDVIHRFVAAALRAQPERGSHPEG